ncbi:PqiB family protein [Kosakonia oryzae]|uniref:PqiB family protein n=1 Tax=Kosakonia oryzae TaxID=497725 RepID=UPI001D0734E3|nr:MlaD family protein [Kosakonia oryzae]UDJ83502.1 MCE family protein [Kosakonia oryzae]
MMRFFSAKPQQLFWRNALIWLIPALALAITITVLLQSRFDAGPALTLSFRSAAGLEAGKTVVKFKDVTIGTVSDITLSPDDNRVLVHVKLKRSAADLARFDSRFWVVRPRVGMSGVSGIDTLISGAYIDVDKGKNPQPRSEFIGLENPPPVIGDTPGSQFIVDAEDLGSLDSGSPVYYRKVQVGKVTSWYLRSDGKGVRFSVFIEAPYDHLVTANTRFWNASGIDLSAGTDGIRLRTGTVAAILSGGIAFSTPEGVQPTALPAPANYTLAADETSAMAPADGDPVTFRLRFEHSLHGLAVGAPVTFSSVVIGRVKAINLDYDARQHFFPTMVDIDVYPSRLGNVLDKLPRHNGDLQQATALFTRELVARGLRAQASTGNLLTGQLFISIDFFPNAPAAPFDIHELPLRIPTVNGGLDEIQQQVASIVGKVDKLPLESLGNNLNATLLELNAALRSVNGQTLPATNRLLAQTTVTTRTIQDLLAGDSPLMINILGALTQASRTLKSLRGLSDQLERNPQSLLIGKPAEPDLLQAKDK